MEHPDPCSTSWYVTDPSTGLTQYVEADAESTARWIAWSRIRGPMPASARADAEYAALEVIRASDTNEPRFSAEQARQIIEERTVTVEPDEEVLNSNEIAQRLGLKSREAVHDWLRKGKILGWQTANCGYHRGYLFPVKQFDQHNRPIEGLGEIVALFEYAEVAWDWLTTPVSSLDGEKPLSMLARGERERVVDAAKRVVCGRGRNPTLSASMLGMAPWIAFVRRERGFIPRDIASGVERKGLRPKAGAVWRFSRRGPSRPARATGPQAPRTGRASRV